MSADHALRTAYFSLNLVSGSMMLILFVTLCLGIRQIANSTATGLIFLSFSRVVTAVISCLLLFAGEATGKTASKALCIAQSGLHTAQTPFATTALFTYLLNLCIFLLLHTSALGVKFPLHLASRVSLLLPIVVIATFSVIGSLTAFHHPNTLQHQSLYCSLVHHPLPLISTIWSGAGFLAIVGITVYTLWVLSNANRRDEVPDLLGLEQTITRLLCLAVYTGFRGGIILSNSFSSTSVEDLVDASEGIVLYFILGTQRWIFRFWGSWLRTLLCASPNGGKFTDDAITYSIGSRSHAPHITTGAHQPTIQRSPSSEWAVKHPRIVASVSDLADPQAIHIARMRALTGALGLASSNSLGSIKPHISKRFSSPRGRVDLPNSSSVAHDSSTSSHFGLAMGHPSTDVTPDPFRYPLNESLSEEHDGSFIVVSLESSNSLSNEIKQVAHQGIAEANVQNIIQEETHPIRRKSSSLRAVVTRSPGPSQESSLEPLRLPSPPLARGSVDFTAGHSFSPHRASFIPILTAASNSDINSPGAQTEFSFHLPLDSPLEVFGTTYANREHVRYSDNSGLTEPILVDRISSPSLTWPNVSPSISHEGRSPVPSDQLNSHTSQMDGSMLGGSAFDSETASTFGRIYRTPLSTMTISHEASPSPLHLDNEDVDGVGLSQIPSESSLTTTQFRRDSTYLPPGLHEMRDEPTTDGRS